MTAPGTPPARPARAGQRATPPLAVRARDVLAFEWTKFRSVRSTYWTLLIAVITPPGISAIVASSFTAGPAAGRPRAGPLLPSLVSLEYAVLAIGVLGVLAFTSEHATGLIAVTFAAVPRRRAVLAAKAAVTGTAALITGELVSFASFFLTQVILSRDHRGVSLSHPGAPRAVLAQGILLLVCAMTGLGLGAIIRHTAGAIAALFGLILALPLIVMVLPAPWNDRIGKFALLDAAEQASTLHTQAHLLSPGLSLLVLTAWPAATMVAAALLITRRDA